MRKWLIAMLLCGLCHTVAFAYGYDNHTPSKSWGYQPVYTTTAAPASSASVASAPTYRFSTTSSYIRALGAPEPDNLMRGSGMPRRTSSWDEDDDPIGVVPDPVPVGDTPWYFILLLLAGYGVRKILRKNLCKNLHICNFCCTFAAANEISRQKSAVRKKLKAEF